MGREHTEYTQTGKKTRRAEKRQKLTGKCAQLENFSKASQIAQPARCIGALCRNTLQYAKGRIEHRRVHKLTERDNYDRWMNMAGYGQCLQMMQHRLDSQKKRRFDCDMCQTPMINNPNSIERPVCLCRAGHWVHHKCYEAWRLKNPKDSRCPACVVARARWRDGDVQRFTNDQQMGGVQKRPFGDLDEVRSYRPPYKPRPGTPYKPPPNSWHSLSQSDLDKMPIHTTNHEAHTNYY